MSITLDDIYSMLPGLKCKRKCQDSCGPFMVGAAEHLRIQVALAEADGYEPDGGPFICKMLSKGGGCVIYKNRPLVCRLWGMASDMPCQWGCKPDWYVSDELAGRLLKLAHEVTP